MRPPAGVNLKAFESKLYTKFCRCGRQTKPFFQGRDDRLPRFVSFGIHNAFENLANPIAKGMHIVTSDTSGFLAAFYFAELQQLIDEREQAARIFNPNKRFFARQGSVFLLQ